MVVAGRLGFSLSAGFEIGHLFTFIKLFMHYVCIWPKHYVIGQNELLSFLKMLK